MSLVSPYLLTYISAVTRERRIDCLCAILAPVVVMGNGQWARRFASAGGNARKGRRRKREFELRAAVFHGRCWSGGANARSQRGGRAFV